MPCWPTSLELKPNLGETLDRFDAWWLCQNHDRPIVTTYVQGEPRPAPAQRATLEDAWMDPEWHVEAAEAGVRSRLYLAENVPSWFPNVGPEVLATVFGAELEFGTYTSWTSWAVPPFERLEQLLDLPLDFGNRYWQVIEEATRLGVQRGQGVWITGYTDLHPNADLLASLIEPQELLMQAIEEPELFAEVLARVTPGCIQAYDRLAALTLEQGEPAITWMPTPYRGRMYVACCDLSAMLSPATFRDAVLPAVRTEAEAMDRTIYHLDGPSALPHLPALLAEPSIHAIQWVYGAGNEPASRWIDVYKQIQEAGKAMEVVAVSREDALNVAQALRPEGVWLDIGGSMRPDEVDEVLMTLEALHR